MVLCPLCKLNVSRDDKKSFTCSISTCQAIYHGKCLNLGADIDGDKDKTMRKNWICPNCEKNRKKGERIASPPGTDQQPSSSDSTQLMLAAIKSLTDEVRGLKCSIDANATEIKEIKDSLEKQISITFENAERMKAIESLLEKQNTKIDGLVSENNTLKTRVSELEIRLNKSEQQHLIRSVEIRGVPARQGDSLMGLVKNIGTGLGFNLEPEEIDSVERLRSRQDDSPGPLLVRFTRQSTRDEWVQRRRVMRDFSTRHLGWQENDSHKIFIGEAMSGTNKLLYWLARQKRTAGKIKYVWFSGGKVKCRREDGQQVVVINCPADLDVFG